MPVKSVSPWWWVPVAAILVSVDFATGPYFQFPSVYILAVAGAGWFSGARTGLALAAVLPLSRVILMLTVWNEPWETGIFIATAITRFVVFSVMAVLASRLAQHERAMAHEVEVLSTLLRVCSYCRKICGADERWMTLDTYMSEPREELSAGLCPHCAQANFPEHFAPPPRT